MTGKALKAGHVLESLQRNSPCFKSYTKLYLKSASVKFAHNSLKLFAMSFTVPTSARLKINLIPVYWERYYVCIKYAL